MGSKEKLQGHFDRLAAKATASLDEYAHTGNFEALHQFRVQVKKMRAMLRVYTKHITKKQLTTLKKTYRAAGVIRMAGIHLDLLRQMGAGKTILLVQYQEYNDLAARFRQDAGKDRNHFKSSCHALRNDLEAIKNSEIIWRFLERIDRISELLNMPETPETRHQARILIKDIMYAYPFASLAVRKKLVLNMPCLDELQDKIGSWHDTVVFSDRLAKPGLKDPGFLEKLEKQRKRQKTEMDRSSYAFNRMALIFQK